jgi:hypothetical protein
MIVTFTDRDGDPVIVDADRIVGLEVATVKYDDDTHWKATVITVDRGVRFYVAESIGVVYERWMQARGERVGPKINPYPQARGWELHPALSTDGEGGHL